MFGLGYVVAAGFGLGSLMGNPRRHRRHHKKIRRNAPISKMDARSMRHVLKTHGFRCNPGSIDAEGARELELFIVNDSYTYRQVQAIIANLAKKIKKGTYDHAKAVKLWGYAADTGAQRYTKEYGAGGANGSYGSFNKPTRMAVAVELQKYYQDELNEAAGVKTNPQHRDVEERHFRFGLVSVEIMTWRLPSATAGIAVKAFGPGGVKAWEAKSQGPSAGGYHKPTQAAERVYFKITGSWPAQNFGGGEAMYKTVAEAAAMKANPRRSERATERDYRAWPWPRKQAFSVEKIDGGVKVTFDDGNTYFVPGGTVKGITRRLNTHMRKYIRR